MRLFIACKLSKEAKKEIISVQEKLNFGKFTNVKENAMHLTLKFLGEVDERKVAGIKQKLSEIRFKEFSVKLDKVGVFPNENNVRVIWAGLKPAEKIIELQQQIEKSLVGFFSKDKQDNKFHPHLTVARVKFVENKKKLKELISALKVKPVEFSVGGFELIKSELAGGGPKYEVLQSFHPNL